MMHEKSRARAEEIARRFEAGESPSDLAIRVGLSLNRVREILYQYCGYRRGKGRQGKKRTSS
jgi:hypothetical protein